MFETNPSLSEDRIDAIERTHEFLINQHGWETEEFEIIPIDNGFKVNRLEPNQAETTSDKTEPTTTMTDNNTPESSTERDSEIPPYKVRKRIVNAAKELTRHEEPAIGGEEAGLERSDVLRTLDSLEGNIERTREYMREQ